MKLHLLLPIAPHRSRYRLNPPPSPHRLWKNCLPKPVPGAKKVGGRCVIGPSALSVPQGPFTWTFDLFPTFILHIPPRPTPCL